LEGEEEAGSPNLQRRLELHKNLLGGDLLITGTGPVHQSGRPLVFFGNSKAFSDSEITTFGPIAPCTAATTETGRQIQASTWHGFSLR